MGSVAKSQKMPVWLGALVLAASAYGCSQSKNKTYSDEGGNTPGTVSSGGGGGSQAGSQMVTIPVELNYKTKSFSLASATTFDISLEGCATGYTSTADENSTALQVYKFDVGCKAKLTQFTFGGITYTPTLLVAYGGPWAENYFYETTDVYGDAKLKRFIPQNVLYLKASRRNAWFREEEHVFKRLAASAKKVVDAGGRVTIGGHGQLQGIQCHWEMWALQSGGMTNFEVLRAATIHGAEALGYAQDIGSLEVGKLADLLVLRKDPLANIRNTNTIHFVMKNGELFDADSMDQLWPAAKKLSNQWWWNQQPK